MSKQARCLLGSITQVVKTWAPVDVQAHTISIAISFLETLGTPLSTRIVAQLRAGDIRAAVSHRPRPCDYESREAFELDYQASSFLKKCPLRHPELNPEDAAREKFFLAEVSCHQTNRRFWAFRRDPLEGAPRGVASVLHTAAVKIERLISSITLDEVVRNARFGPGAVVGGGRFTAAYDKICAEPSVTDAFRILAAEILRREYGWAQQALVQPVGVPGNRVTFVPKDATTHRAIAIEPSINVYFQLGMGTCLRRRLKRVGIDLSTQAVNQRLAEIGSSAGHLATLDLSSASDTIAFELVRELLPADVFRLLCWLRSPCFTIGSPLGHLTMSYGKFSSMGNGFTFELETLIFWALALGVAELEGIALKAGENFAVYGDDIIIPTSMASRYIEVLEFCGFKTNKDKSFVDGPFRESCGKDYWHGTDVRPILLKELLSDAPSHIRLANAISHYAWNGGRYSGHRHKLLAVRDEVVSKLPQVLRSELLGPAYVRERIDPRDYVRGSPLKLSRDPSPIRAPDLWLHVPWDAAQRSRLVIPNRCSGWVHPTLVAKPSTYVLGGDSRAYSAWLYATKDGLADAVDPSRVTNRGVVRYEAKHTQLSGDSWDDFH